MKLEFGTLSFKGFKAFVEPQQLDFASYPVGVHFIRGVNLRVRRPESNGAAKSTIFDAASWCLFGKTVEGLRNPDVAPWTAPKMTTDVAWCVKVDGELHTIWRTANPNTLTLDGEKAGQEDIERLIRITPSVFNNAILLGQDQDLFFDLTPAEKMVILSEALGLDRWLERASTSAKIVVDMEKRQTELEMDQAGLESSLEELTTLIRTAEDRSREWNALRKGRLGKINKQIADLKKELAKQQKLKDKADLALESAGMEADAMEREVAKVNAEVNEATHTRQLLARDLERLSSELDTLGEADVCPTCGQDLKGTGLEKHKRELRAEINKTNIALKFATGVAEKKTKLRDLTITARKDFVRKATEAQQEVNLYSPRVTEIETTLRGLNTTLLESEEDRDPFREQAVEMKRKVRKLECDRDAVAADMTVLTQRIARTAFWAKQGFKEVRLFKIEEVLQELQMVSNTILADVGLDDWELSFGVEKETQAGNIKRGIVVFIQSPDSQKPVRWESWSGGERQRLRIVGALALAEVLLGHAGIIPSITVLDEPTKNLSDEGVEDLCVFLSVRAKELGTRFWLIDHMAEPSRHFGSVITVEKGKDGTSNILP